MTLLNRGTFYFYFLDMSDLLTQVEDDIIHDLQGRLIARFKDGSYTNFNAISYILLEIFLYMMTNSFC